jgi:hypothetical protein
MTFDIAPRMVTTQQEREVGYRRSGDGRADPRGAA